MSRRTSLKKRCPWVNLNNSEYVLYHDQEWGKPVHDDRLLFEMLILEGAQAGLSWETVLKKRARYQEVFANFDPIKVAKFTPKKVATILQDPGIIRNRLKVASTISNATAFLKVQKEWGSFAKYLWHFVDNRPILNHIVSIKDCVAKTTLSDRISKDLKKRGFRFVGSTIIYAYLQAVGVVNDHFQDCFKSRKQQHWSLYMIQTASGSLYTGVATNVARRFQEHAEQGVKCAKYLRGKAPLKLVYQEQLGSKSAALKREYEIKQLPKMQKHALITHAVKS